MNAKKAAYVATVYSHLSVFHRPFMKMLQDKGYEVHAYARPDHCREDVESAGIECRDMPFHRSPLSIANLVALKRMFGKLKEERYELIHVHTPNASVVCRIAARLAGCRNVAYTAHGFHFFKGASKLNWLLYYPVERFLSRWTDRLIVINGEDWGRAKRFPVRGKAAYVPGVGVDIQAYRGAEREDSAKVRESLGAGEGDFVLLCIAEFIPRKNHEQLLRALKEMLAQGVPVVCWLAGNGEGESRARQLADELGLGSAVKFLGFRRDIPELVQAADALTLLSSQEGLPKALLEGLAAGKPMVATDVRGSRDLVLPFENGFRVAVGDAAGTAQALTELAKNARLRERMGRRSLEMAEAYELKAIEEALAGIYAELAPPEAERATSQINGEGMVL